MRPAPGDSAESNGMRVRMHHMGAVLSTGDARLR